jgi:hypothetical protein
MERERGERMTFDSTAKGRMDRIFDSIYEERVRQETLKLQGKFKFSCADVPGLTLSQKYTVLGEESGEVARVLLNMNELTDDFFRGKFDLPADGRQVELKRKLQKELIEVAAVTVAWLESIAIEEEQQHAKS